MKRKSRTFIFLKRESGWCKLSKMMSEGSLGAVFLNL